VILLYKITVSITEFSNTGLYLRVLREGIDYFFLVHIHLKAALYKSLDL
jgi:hypothetical protein